MDETYGVHVDHEYDGNHDYNDDFDGGNDQKNQSYTKNLWISKDFGKYNWLKENTSAKETNSFLKKKKKTLF